MILETKLSLPQPKAGALLRTGLIELIRNNLDKKLILITAGAGYGKTTLLGQLIKTAQLPAVFYHLDQGDSDLLTFYSYFTLGLEHLSPGLAARSSGLLKQAEQMGNDHELLMGTLINELVEKRKEELFFVLDDYQNVADNSNVHQALNYFIDHLPDIVHVIIATRANAQFACLSKWNAKQDAFMVACRDLHFSAGEVSELLSKAYGQTADAADLKSLLEHTEGWITGIQLILANIRGAGRGKTVKEALAGYLETDRAAPGGLFQYFAGEIISRETQTVRNIFAAGAILETATAEACDAILGTSDSRQLLQDMARRNLFVSQLGPDEYNYHRLFREYLLEQSTAEAKRAFHQKAAGYFQQRGMTERAIGHWLAAGNSAPAAGLIASIADDLMEQGRHEILSGWLAKIPGEITDKNPKLLVISAALLREQGRLEESEALFRRAVAALSKNQAGKPGTRPILADALLEYASLFWVKGAFPEALRMANKALAACPGTAAELKAHILNMLGLLYVKMGNWENAKSCLLKAAAAAGDVKSIYLNIGIENNLADLMNARGETKLAFEHYALLIAQIGSDYFYQVGIIFYNAAQTALEYGQSGLAEKWLSQGQQVCRYINDVKSQAVLNWGCGNLHAAKGQWQQAEKNYLAAMTQLRAIDLENNEISLLIELGHLKRYAGDHGRSREYYCRALAASGQNDSYLRAVVLLGLSKTDSLCLEYESAGQRIKEAQGILKRIGDNSMEFNVLLAKAILYSRQGMMKKCAPLLSNLIGLAKEKGYHGILARELRHNPDLAAMAFACRRENAYLEFLRSQLSGSENDLPGTAALNVRFFGALRMVLPGNREIPLKWRSLKSASLFAYLLLHRDRLCNREELMNVLWPRVSTLRAGQNLRDSVYLLKKALAAGLRQTGKSGKSGLSLIEHHDKGYGIEKGFSFRLDAEEFQKVWDDSRNKEAAGNAGESLQGYRQCVELYCDDFLPNLGEWWCEEYRARYQKMYLFALHKLAMDAANTQDYTRTADYYRRYLGKDPYFEEARIGLWGALKALGKQAEIRKDYNEYCRLLKKELKEKVPEKIRQFYEHLIISGGN